MIIKVVQSIRFSIKSFFYGLGHTNTALASSRQYTVKKVSDFPVPSQDVTYQTLPGMSPRQKKFFDYSPPARVWLVTFRLGTGKSLSYFYSVLSLKNTVPLVSTGNRLSPPSF
jgi:hypothetical protein